MPKRYRPFNRRRGVLSFEWIVLITLVAVGIIGGLTAVRDSIVEELGEVAGAMMAIDQSFTGFGTSFVDPRQTVTTCRPDAGKGGTFAGGPGPTAGLDTP
jgi:Flp pilus assembly pilin Flp